MLRTRQRKGCAAKRSLKVGVAKLVRENLFHGTSWVKVLVFKSGTTAYTLCGIYVGTSRTPRRRSHSSRTRMDMDMESHATMSDRTRRRSGNVVVVVAESTHGAHHCARSSLSSSSPLGCAWSYATA